MNANLKCPIKLFLMYFSVFSISCNQNCTVDPTQDVLKRLETVGQDFSQRFGEAVGPHCVALGWQVRTDTEEEEEEDDDDGDDDAHHSQMIQCVTCVFLLSFRDSNLASDCITKSWRRC